MDSAARQWRNKLGSYGDGALMVGHSAAVVRAALSTTAGYDLLRRLEKLERVAEAAAELSEVAQLRGDNVLPEPPDDPKRWSARMNDAWGELDASLAALDGDGK